MSPRTALTPCPPSHACAHACEGEGSHPMAKMAGAIGASYSEVPKIAPSPRWRILFLITTSDVGGTETAMRELVLRIDRHHFDPVVCSLCPPGRVGQQIVEAGTRVVTLAMSSRPRLVELATGTVRLARLIDELEVDLIQAFLYRANTLAGLAARLARRRPVVVSGQRSLTPWSGWPAAVAARWTRPLSDRIVAVSEAVRAELIHTDRVKPERIIVIENGVDVDHYQATDASAVRAELGYAPQTVVVGGVGRLSKEKGFHHLIESVAQLRASGLPVSLMLAGDGPDRLSLEQRARSLGLDGHAKFLGVRADPRPVYAAMDVFALPSLEEGSPNALLEAMACGRAVVVSNVGGVASIVEHERSGLLVPAQSPELFAAALRRVVMDRGLRHKLGGEARRRVRSEFSISGMVRRHERLYRDLIGGTTSIPI